MLSEKSNIIKMQLVNKLLPCPFCGCKDVLICLSYDNYAWCKNCGSTGQKFKLPRYTGKKNYIGKVLFNVYNAWNRRV